ncbi:dienelactone hydrolase family protein [Polaromonas sp.]|jgi:carboxymethylenebutenolidase|uniref:dienelactone hydrolase family protein n=1 Tax=Polaromonas sp. TaxID=1869339 RepID=UPI0037C9EDED
MIEQHMDIPGADGAMNSFVVCPEEGGPHPVVLFYMDAPGKREELHDMARRIAAVGYYVVLPNLYYRRSRDFWLTERTERQMAVMFEHMNSLSNAMVVRDTEAMLRFVDAQPQADASRVGAVGYCMSGPFVMAAAAALPERIKGIASIHGANLVTDKDDSPHLMAPLIRCESYFACAETDRWAPPEIVHKLQDALVAGGTPHRIEWYPGTEHGFVFPKRAGFYHQAAAERHWERLFDLFRRTLQA